MKNKKSFPSFVHYLAISFIIVSLLITGIWVIAFPADRISEFIENSVNTGSTGIEIKGLKKGLFYNLNIERLALKNKDVEIFHIENISMRINPVYLFLLSLESSFSGNIHDGIVAGRLSIGRNKRLGNIKLNNADIKDIPYLETIGFKGTGTLNADGIINGNNIAIKFVVDSARFETVTFSGVSLPMEIFDKAKGRIDVSSKGVDIDSFSLEGKGIYGRIKGRIKAGIADLNLEIMEDASAEGKIPVLIFMDKYRVSPGYYVIPVKTKNF